MTQTPLSPPNNQVSPPGYATGVPGTPVTGVSAGTSVGINYPATPARGSPVPTNLPWVVLLNSSPFTLLVTSGGVVTQIAAFSVDLIFVIPQTTPPLTVLPQSGGQIISPGSDTTIYTTWYEAKPPGQFPAALGSGAVNTQVSTSLLSQILSPGVGPVGVTVGPFNVAGFGSVRATLGEISGLGPVQFLFSWLQPGPYNAVRLIGIDAGDAITVVLPNFTDTLQIRIINQNAVAAQPTIDLHAYTPALETFADPSTHGMLMTGSQVVANGATFDAFSGPSPGPAHINVSVLANGGAGFSSVVAADITGNNSYASLVQALTRIPTDPQPRQIDADLILPSAPLRLRMTNNTGAGTTITWALVTDTFRAG